MRNFYVVLNVISMKIEKISDKSYRVRKQINGNRVSLMFDHKPTQQEILTALSDNDFSAEKGSFLYCAQSYIGSKSNVLSPSTIKGYHSILDNVIPADFKNKKVSQITQQDVQLIINEYSANHTPKSVRNVHGFISAVLRQFRPKFILYTTLPQKRENEHYTPSETDIKRILDASKNDKAYHIGFQLGVMGMRRSEICALTLDDLDGNILTINKALVQGVGNEWHIKTTKTTAGTRKLYVPDSLVKEIHENGYIFNGYPNKLYVALKRYQKKLGIAHFRFHDLRHFFASYAHSQGISDADIMATGGWKSDYTMKQIYRHEMDAQNAQKAVYNKILG